MDLNSCLYETTIMHHRLSPKTHKFSYRFFSFYLDLDELDVLSRKIRLFSWNKGNVYALYDRDHMQIPGNSIKGSVMAYLREQGIDLTGGRVMMLAYLRTFGYVFNPVTFYYCFDKNNIPVCVIPEIGNTFGELKPFFIGEDHLREGKFTDRQDKYYYISPFTRLDDQLDFKLTIPGDKLNVRIDTSREGQKVILTSMVGNKRALTNRNILWFTVKFPLITLKVITLIHWHAFLLWMKKIPFEEKTNNMHLQKGVHRA